MAVNTQSSSIIGRHLNFIISPDDEILQQQVGDIRVRDIFILDIHRQTGQAIPEISRGLYCYCQGQMQRSSDLNGQRALTDQRISQDNHLWNALISISKIYSHLLFIIRSVCWFLYCSTIYKQQRATKNHSRNVMPFCAFLWAERGPYGATKVCNIKDGLQLSSMMNRKNI